VYKCEEEDFKVREGPHGNICYFYGLIVKDESKHRRPAD